LTGRLVLFSGPSTELVKWFPAVTHADRYSISVFLRVARLSKPLAQNHETELSQPLVS